MMVTFVLLLIHVHFWFFLSLLKKRNDVVDIGWGLGFALLIIGQTYFHPFFSDQVFPSVFAPSLVVVILIAFWALRLSAFIGSRSKNFPEDERYRKMKQGWQNKNIALTSYFRVFWLQGVILLALVGPFLYFVTKNPVQNSPLILIVSGGLALAGILIESLADYQKSQFKKQQKLSLSQGEFIRIGLWKNSRHPNYFGEIVFWFGLSLLAFIDIGQFWNLFLTPVLMYFLLTRVSGIPLIDKKFQENQKYQELKKETNALWPFSKPKS